MTKLFTKKYLICTMICAIMMLGIFVLCDFFGKNDISIVQAEPMEEKEISYGDIDPILYSYLLFLRDGKYYGENESYEKLKTNDFLDRTELQINSVRDGEFKLFNIDGLGLFNLQNLRILNVSDNNIKSITQNAFLGMTELTTLDVSGNNIESLDISNLTSITNLYAQNSKLKFVDLKNLKSNGYVNLSCNEIENIDLLNLKEDGMGAKVDLYNNKIANFVADNYVNYDFIIGFQNIYTSYDETTNITLFKYGEQDFWLEFVDTKRNTAIKILDSAKLPPAEYKIYLKNQSGDLGYDVIDLKIYKTAPTFVAKNDKGEILDLSKNLKGNVTIYFDSNSPNYVVEYSINGGEYAVGDKVTLNENGTYTFSLRSRSEVEDVSIGTAFTIKIFNKGHNILNNLLIIFAVLLLAALVSCVLAIYHHKKLTK